MSEYRSGTVTFTNASSVVRADSLIPPNFTINVNQGDIIKKRYENIFYEVGAVVSATRLHLSSNYAGTTVSGTEYVVVRNFTPNQHLPEMSSGDVDFTDIYTKALRKIDKQLGSVNTWIQDTSATHTRISASAFYTSADTTGVYGKDRFVRIRGNVVAASANRYSVVATPSHYNATTNRTYVPLETAVLSATPTRYYYGPQINILPDQITDAHIDFGTGSNQVNALDIPILDSSEYFNASTVETALTELKKDYLAMSYITGTLTRYWVSATACHRASYDTFTASGNKVSLYSLNTAIMTTATGVSAATTWSRVATTPHYNATTGVTRVVLASSIIPENPKNTGWYRDVGNTATRFRLRPSIHNYPNDFFNSKYYIDFTTGSNTANMKQVKDWTASIFEVVATTTFAYVPKYGDAVRFIGGGLSITVGTGLGLSLIGGTYHIYTT